MSTPLYKRGMAVPGSDKPFHALENLMAVSGATKIDSTGEEAAGLLFDLSRRGREDQLVYPIPQDCPDMVRGHECDTPDNCTHNKQCGTNTRMWRSESHQRHQELYYAGRLSDELAQHLLDFFLEDVENLRNELCALLQSHGDLVTRKWKKMSKDKRGRMLSETDFRVFGEWPVVLARCGNPGCYEEHYHNWSGGMWLDLRELAEDPMKLLSIFHVRTAYTASSWTMFDTSESINAWAKDYYGTWYNERCVTMCGKNYGTLCSFDAERAHKWAVVGFPRALTTVQAQHELLYTLQKIMKTIIGENSATGAAHFEVVVSSGLRTSGGDAAWSSYTHQAFTAPKAFDTRTALSKAKARFDMIQDELWLMQTEPGYIQDVIHSRRAAIRSIATGMHQRGQVPQAAGLLIDELITRFHLWYTVYRTLEDLQRHVPEHQTPLQPGQMLSLELSAKFAEAGGMITARLEMAKRSFAKVLHKDLCASESCAHSMTSGGRLNIEPKLGLDPYGAAGRLQWRLRTLVYAPERETLINGHAYTINAMMEEDKEAKLMDISTHGFLSDIAVLDELSQMFTWSQCVIDREWVSSGLGSTLEPCRDCRILDDEWVIRIGPLIRQFTDVQWLKKGKTIDRLESAVECRRRLARLWTAIGDERMRVARSGCKDLASSSEMFKSAIAFESDPAYLAKVEDERRLLDSERARLAAEAKARLEQTLLSFGSEAQDVPVRYKQTKAKSKRIAAALGQSHAQPTPTPTPNNESCRLSTPYEALSGDVECPAIAVKKESLAVFRRIFGTTGGDIRWSLFVQAMVDAGFTAGEAAGSAVNFSNGSGGICFHRPHPDPVLDPIMLHNVARRMHKRFGWTAELFVERARPG